MKNFSNKFKNFIFDPSSTFWGANVFFQKSQLSHTTLNGPLMPCEFQNKLMSQSQEKFQTEGQKDGRTDRL